jgi:hypothetical protein
LALGAIVAVALPSEGGTAGLFRLGLGILDLGSFSTGSADALIAPEDPSRHADASVKERIVFLNSVKTVRDSRLLHISLTETPGTWMKSGLWSLIKPLTFRIIRYLCIISSWCKARTFWVDYVEVFIDQDEHMLLGVKLHLLEILLSRNYNLLFIEGSDLPSRSQALANRLI